MKLLIIGSGGVGQSVAMIIKRAGREGDWAEKIVLSDYNLSRAEEVAALCNDPRFIAEQIDAGNADRIKELINKHGITQVLNAVEPVFNENIFDTCFDCGVGYMDCAMTLSKKHPEKPFELTHIKLGDYQFARHEKWEKAGNMALVGSGVEPGMADVLARFAQNTFLIPSTRSISVTAIITKSQATKELPSAFLYGPLSKNALTHRSSGKKATAGSAPSLSRNRKYFLFPAASAM